RPIRPIREPPYDIPHIRQVGDLVDPNHEVTIGVHSRTKNPPAVFCIAVRRNVRVELHHQVVVGELLVEAPQPHQIVPTHSPGASSELLKMRTHSLRDIHTLKACRDLPRPVSTNLLPSRADNPCSGLDFRNVCWGYSEYLCNFHLRLALTEVT